MDLKYFYFCANCKHLWLSIINKLVKINDKYVSLDLQQNKILYCILPIFYIICKNFDFLILKTEKYNNYSIYIKQIGGLMVNYTLILLLLKYFKCVIIEKTF